MKMVSVRISEEEKRQLKKYGRLSDTLREGMKLYLKKRNPMSCYANWKNYNLKTKLKPQLRKK
jgi:hypothetical protein